MLIPVAKQSHSVVCHIILASADLKNKNKQFFAAPLDYEIPIYKFLQDFSRSRIINRE